MFIEYAGSLANSPFQTGENFCMNGKNPILVENFFSYDWKTILVIWSFIIIILRKKSGVSSWKGSIEQVASRKTIAKMCDLLQVASCQFFGRREKAVTSGPPGPANLYIYMESMGPLLTAAQHTLLSVLSTLKTRWH